MGFGSGYSQYTQQAQGAMPPNLQGELAGTGGIKGDPSMMQQGGMGMAAGPKDPNAPQGGMGMAAGPKQPGQQVSPYGGMGMGRYAAWPGQGFGGYPGRFAGAYQPYSMGGMSNYGFGGSPFGMGGYRGGYGPGSYSPYGSGMMGYGGGSGMYGGPMSPFGPMMPNQNMMAYGMSGVSPMAGYGYSPYDPSTRAGAPGSIADPNYFKKMIKKLIKKHGGGGSGSPLDSSIPGHPEWGGGGEGGGGDGPGDGGGTCFAKGTLFELPNGEFKPVEDFKPGDEIRGGYVQSIVRGETDDDWYNYDGTVVTSDHIVQENGTWKFVSDADRAEPTENEPFYYTLITSDSQLYGVNDAVFTDHQVFNYNHPAMDIEDDYASALIAIKNGDKQEARRRLIAGLESLLEKIDNDEVPEFRAA